MVKRKAALKAESGFKRRRTSPSPNRKKEKDEKFKEPRRKSTRGKKAAKIAKPKPTAGSTGVHPLLIDHIVDKIFQHIICPKTTAEEEGEPPMSVAKSVQNLRLVCKQWKDSATRLYRRNRAPMPFGVINPYESPSKSDKRMLNFLEVMKDANLIPVKRYTINANFFVKENQKLMNDFMRVCGPDAVELCLYFDNSSTMKFTRRSFPDLNLSRLKTLRFQCEHYRGKHFTSQPYEILCLVEVLLSAADSLQEFRFEFSSRDGKWSHSVVKRFGEFISKRIPKTVKILRLDMPLNDLHLNTLAESELKLEEFQFDCQCVASSKVIRKFFEKQTTTLKVLKILDGSPASTISLDFPRFDELLHMELQGATIQRFSYPDAFPKLASLNVAEWKTESTCVELLCCPKKGMSLKEIHLPYRFAQVPLVKKAAQSFPNISKLHISPSQDISETLQEVFVYFANVEELYISFPFLLDNELNADSIFSGVSELDCRRIMKHRNFNTINVRDVQHRQSILSLTKLKKLVLEDSACDVILTDFSVHFVFLKMASLNELHTSRFRMSPKYVDLLREKLTLKLIADDFFEFASDDDDADGWDSF